MDQNSSEFDPMASASAAPARSPRMAQALAFLSELEPKRFPEVVLARIRGTGDLPLPRLARDEKPVDIFVDVAERGSTPHVADSLRAASATLLGEFVGGDLVSHAPVVSELCYLAARIGSFQALDALRILAQREDAAMPTPTPGEDLRLRALRCLVGLLGSAPRLPDPERFKAVLEQCAQSPNYKLIAMTGLIGMWPEYKNRGELPSLGIDEALLNVSLTVAGFRPA